MSQKKETPTNTTAEDQAQVEQLLGQIQHIATELNAAADQQQATAALADIEDIPESGQIALVKALAKARNNDAADVLSAINELGAQKSVRKEARRALIQLEAARVYPRWTAPGTREPLVQFTSTQSPRFWRGYASQSREEGEMYVVLSWEQGFDYGEVRMLTFLVDFWEQGVKDFILETMPKRSFDERTREMKQQLANVTITDCTLAEGRRLLEEALAVNKWRGTSPHKEFRRYQPMINQLILNAADVGADRGLTFISPQLEPDELVATFIAGWSLGDYGLAYDMFSRDSSLRDGMTRDEWIEQRRDWSNEAHPTRFELSYVREREASAATSAIWLPSAFLPAGRASARKEIEITWSLELTGTPLTGTLNEMALATAVYKETGRHWFWTSYTLAQEDGQWRVQKMTDEGANAQALSIDELHKRIEQHTDRVNEIMQTFSPRDANAQQLNEEIIWRMIQCIYYDDALIMHLPLDRAVYGDAYNRAISLGAIERAVVYLDRLASKFAEQKADVLRELGVALEGLSENYRHLNMEERAQQFAALAEQNLRESLAMQDEAATRGVLAEHLIRQDGDLNEAEQHLLHAREMITSNNQQITIEDDLASIAIKRGQLKEALQYYQRIAEINPDAEALWLKMATVQQRMQQPEAARETIEQAIERYPREYLPYAQLATLYINEKMAAKAQETLERGLRAIPDSAPLLALLASVHVDSGDFRSADATLKQAERLAPNLEIVQAARAMLNRDINKQ